MTKEEKQLIKDFFQEELEQCESAIRVNSVENNKEMVQHWQESKGFIRRIQIQLLNKLKIKL